MPTDVEVQAAAKTLAQWLGNSKLDSITQAHWLDAARVALSAAEQARAKAERAAKPASASRT